MDLMEAYLVSIEGRKLCAPVCRYDVFWIRRIMLQRTV
jgi:hypothetical protein